MPCLFWHCDFFYFRKQVPARQIPFVASRFCTSFNEGYEHKKEKDDGVTRNPPVVSRDGLVRVAQLTTFRFDQSHEKTIK